MQTLPVHLDLFAFFILLGVAQAVFLGFFFLTGQRGQRVSNRCLGWLMLALSAVIGEIFLCYSNYMFRLLPLVDFSEPLNFVMAPLFFLFVFARIRGQLPRAWGWHFVPAGLWAINSISWLYQPSALKYNNYLHAYHPELPYVAEPPTYVPEDFFQIRDYINELTLVSCLIYNLLTLLIVYQAFRRLGSPFWQHSPVRLAQLRNQTLLFLVLPLLIILIKPRFYEDLGDYLLACYLTVTIYFTSIRVMADSTYFTDEPKALPLKTDTETGTKPKRKYEKSALSEEVEDAVLAKLNRLLETEKPYLESDLSLPKLAGRLNTSPHHVSQLLNDRLGQNFFDWLATYRIAEARQLLNDPTTAHLKIDEIAELVGYNSTSAFHTAFKRLTSQTPAQFREAATASRSA
jgi:AraC-like DNA-binding protein